MCSSDLHHRTLGDIVAILDASTLRDSIKDKARRIFTRLADAEARRATRRAVKWPKNGLRAL